MKQVSSKKVTNEGEKQLPKRKRPQILLTLTLRRD